MITCNNWILVERFKGERERYEEYTRRIDVRKVEFARSMVNETEIKMLKLIHKLRICTSGQIARIIFKGRKYWMKYCNNSLRKLFRLGCIDRFFPLTDKGSPQTHVVLAPIGAKLIGVPRFRRIHTLHQNWRHTVFTNEVLAEIVNKYKLTDWMTEIPLRWIEGNSTYSIRTDAFGGWIDASREETFAMIEVDMGSEQLSELSVKVRNYHRYFHSNEFKTAPWQPYVENKVAIIPRVIFVLQDEERRKKLSSIIKHLRSDVSFETVSFKSLSL